ncbi:amino acid ABC transporter permease [Bradyrhizobium zhanjiangense]|uniref:Glutamate/aspartate import permease protein GltK n=1 Tax=Bradyrhizobium zhanjiangense TaxID=1325107 RepID=A0A4Q0Q567_9BRAD|nr:amino acid ABC transporter permease [Bradyrhizobium zhanjiangense]RXG83877.1 amino acid ABC transporter permease [Bradyrhizobium zhanjiangense]
MRQEDLHTQEPLCDQRSHDGDLSQYEYVRRKHVARYLGGAVILAVTLWIIIAFAHGQIAWSVTWQYLTARTVLLGLGNTILLAVLAMSLGIAIGVTVAIMRFSASPIINGAALAYTWLFRGIPSLLQLLLWFNLALIFPTMGIPGLFELRTVDVMTPFVAALLGLGINQGAYTSEVVRAGLLSVDDGQYEAARAIGMHRLQALRRIILPQAMRVILPPIGNEFIGMVKWTSLTSVVQFSELMYATETIYNVNSRVIELLFVATFWYLSVITVLSLLQSRVERYFARGTGRAAQSR